MLQDILSYIAHNPSALCWGIGIGLMLGTCIVGIGAGRQYDKGRKDGFEAGRAAGYDVGFAEGFEHISDYESPLIRGEGSE